MCGRSSSPGGRSSSWSRISAQAERARQRGAQPVDRPDGRFDAVIAPTGADLACIDTPKIVLVDERGAASMSG
jgi:ribulose-5-phosphate 4-epimerase/fuculose-1-phosphate aldolase